MKNNIKTLKKLKLNRLVSETLENRYMNMLRGGDCGSNCACVNDGSQPPEIFQRSSFDVFYRESSGDPGGSDYGQPGYGACAGACAHESFYDGHSMINESFIVITTGGYY